MKAVTQCLAALCGLLAIGSAATAAQSIATSYSWTSTGPIISPKSDATHDIIAVKDPSAVSYNGQIVVYASDVNSAGDYNMEYLSFPNWSEASSATPYFMDNTPGFSGYHTAPQIFYFAPQNKWYLIFQSGQPQYSTNSDPTKPQNWTEPQNFFASQPASVSNWIDFWVICDSENCYLFFCGDNGNFYRSSTPIGDFPNGFNEPVIVYSESDIYDLFEADNVYTVEGSGGYLADIECLGPQGQRYFRALTATSLGGTWTALGNTNNFSTPFLGEDNVTFESGVTPWTTSFSSGGLVIDGNNQTDSVNPDNLTFLYQGANPTAYADDSYGMIPWQLGLATSNANTTGGGSGTLSGSYSLEPQNTSGMCLDATGFGGAGTAMQLYSCSGGTNQSYNFVSQGSGVYELEPNYNTGLCLDVYGNATSAGTEVDVWTCNGQSNQKWGVANVSGNVYTLAPQNATGLRLDVYGNGTTDGTKIDVWTSNGQTNQKWALVN